MGLLAELFDEVKDVKILSRDEVQERIWALTKKTGRPRKINADKWKNKWLSSDQFLLMEVPLNRIDQPIKPHYTDIVKRKTKQHDPEPIFIDRNRFANSASYTVTRLHGAATYVVDGKHRSEAAKVNKRKTISAWVGIQAVPFLMDTKKKGKWWSDPGLKELQ